MLKQLGIALIVAALVEFVMKKNQSAAAPVSSGGGFYVETPSQIAATGLYGSDPADVQLAVDLNNSVFYGPDAPQWGLSTGMENVVQTGTLPPVVVPFVDPNF